MKNIKEFCKKHKKEIIFTSCLVGAVVIGVLVKGQHKKKLIELAGKNVITWTPGNSFINLEKVKEILDLNANNSELFAIFREGPDPNAYVCILLSDNVLTSK